MFNGKLYSVWIDGVPSPVLSLYHDDGEAMSAFRALILKVREDVASGVLESGSETKMSLYMHGYMHDDGCVRGIVHPMCIMSAVDVCPESDAECEEVTE